jgi:uncharacterized protein YyaL (SSP411 family)
LITNNHKDLTINQPLKDMKAIKQLQTAGMAALIAMPLLPVSMQAQNVDKETFIQENVKYAAAQTERMLAAVGEPTGRNYPRTMKDDGTLSATGMHEWTSGFFPGSLWYLYELTGDAKWKDAAQKWTASLEPLKTYKNTHDLGFMMFCSYGNALRLAPQAEYKDIIVETANSLCTRYSDKTGVIKSWNGFRSWNDDTIRYPYPVIIDNMMNLEMLFYAASATGNKRYKDIAVSHANATLKHHFRSDYSAYHVLLYDTAGNGVTAKHTAQGYSDNSAWSRGQAWAIYGFTAAYRETKDPAYLTAARNAADYYLRGLPQDYIPLWDFNVGMEGYEPSVRSYAVKFKEKLRDASAGAVVCSALFELADLSGEPQYRMAAVRMLHSLASPAYRAALGGNANFLIMHCVGSIPHRVEIDKPLVYADYYFLEALKRYKAAK